MSADLAPSPGPVVVEEPDDLERRVRVTLAAAGAMCVCFVVGWLVGTAQPTTEVVTGSCFAGAAQVSCDLEDDWVVGWEGTVTWIDRRGAWHEGSRPGCLPRRERVTVTLGITDVDAGDTDWKQVLWVDCRG